MADEPIPDGIDVLWGLRERPRRGPKPAMTVDHIVRTAIGIADVEGLGPLSMSRVAEQLGCTPMALYRYVRNKDELLQLMMDVSAADMPASTATGEWRAGLREWTYDLAALYRRHPWVLMVPLASPPAGPGQLTVLDRGLAALRDTPLAPETRLAVIMLLLTYVRGEVRFTVEYEQATRAAAVAIDAERPPLTYGAVLRRLVDARRFPDLAVLVEAGTFDEVDHSYDDAGMAEQFEFGVERVLDGIGALIDG